MEINDLKELAFAFADKAAQKNLAKLAVKTDEFSITVETHAPVAAAAAVSAAPAAEVAVQQAEKIRAEAEQSARQLQTEAQARLALAADKIVGRIVK